jgi:hypothetical protein
MRGAGIEPTGPILDHLVIRLVAKVWDPGRSAVEQ